MLDLIDFIKCIFVIYIILLPVASIKYEFYKIYLEIKDEDHLLEIVDMKIKNNENKTYYTVNYTASSGIQLIEITSDGKKADFIVHEDRRNPIIEIFLDKPLYPNNSVEVSVMFNTTGYVHDYDSKEMFSIAFFFPQEVSYFLLELKLPPSAMLPITEKSDVDLVLFPSGEITSDGRSLIISWIEENVKEGDVLRYFAIYEFPKPVVSVLIVTPEPEKICEQYVKAMNLTADIIDKRTQTRETHGVSEKGDTGDNIDMDKLTPVDILAFLQFFIILMFIYYFFAKKPKPQEVVSKVILKSVDEDEQRVLTLLLENEEPLTQRDIKDISGFSKAKLSRVLMRLENKGFITRTKYGRTNKIRLTRKITGDVEGDTE